MTNVILLEQKISEAGLKKYYIAQQMGLTYQGLLFKLRGYREFKASEIQILSDILHLSLEDRERIFFASEVDETSTS